MTEHHSSGGAGEHRLPFAEIAAACLNHVEALLQEWCPGGHLAGPEWKALNPNRADGKIGSFSVNVTTGRWGDFATGDAGNDLISLYAYLFHGGDQGKSAVELAERFGVSLPPLDKPKGKRRKAEAADKTKDSAAEIPLNESHTEPAVPKPPRTWWAPVRPVPDDAPAPPKAHLTRGVPIRIATYREADGTVIGYVCRFLKTDGSKEDLPLALCRHEQSGKLEWRWMSFATPRPLYGLDRAAALPQATLFFVEGEKCADVAHEQVPELAVLAWPGGCNAIAKVDFSPLADRPVKKAILWRDCDAKREKLSKEEKAAGIDAQAKPLLPEAQQPGTKAMEHVALALHALGYRIWLVDIPKPGDKPDGWDIADAVAEGYSQPTLVEMLRGALPWQPPAPDSDEPPPESISTPSEAAAEEGGKGKGKVREKGPFIPDLIWGRDGLKSCLSNVHQVLAFRPEWQGVVGWNEFSLCVEKLKPPPYAGGAVGEWDSIDDTRTALWLARVCPDWSFTPSSDSVAEVIEALARDHPFHPVRDYLAGLVWDGVPRMENWLEDYLGVVRTDYSMKVAKWWLMGAVNRVMTPGFKFDYCLVLEGPQGKGKSTALSILGGAWFGDTDLDLTHKDSMSALRGKLIYEIAELGALARSEEKRQKSFLSRTQDEYRPVYGRREIKAPRQLIFAGSTNEFEWNKDPTGGRRFWPVECTGEFNLDGLRAMRDQLFAEAYGRVAAKERCYPTQDEQREVFDPEQLKVELQDSLVDAVHDWVYSRVPEFSLYDVAADCLKLDASKLTRDLQTRLGVALRKLGCTRIERRNGMIRYWYKPPARNGASSTTGKPAQLDTEDDYVGF
jgi:predicted P-loop ATPase